MGLTLLIYPLQLTDLERMCKGGVGGVSECGVHHWVVRQGEVGLTFKFMLCSSGGFGNDVRGSRETKEWVILLWCPLGGRRGVGGSIMG